MAFKSKHKDTDHTSGKQLRMASMGSLIQFWAYPLLLSIVFLFSLFPYRMLHATFGRCSYWLAYHLVRYRYSVVIQNLSRSFPEKTYEEIRSIAKDFYRYLSRLLVEMVKLVAIDKARLSGKVHVVNPEILMPYFRQGKNMIGLLGHYGNWECLSILPSRFPFPVNALYKPLSSPMAARLTSRIRTRFGVCLLPAGQALRYLLKTRNRPELTLFIADQFPGAGNGSKVEFLNQPTDVYDGAEKLARITDAAVFYIEVKPGTADEWEVLFSLITASAKQTTEGEITMFYNEKLQQTIRQAPAFWLWSHRRWK